VSAPVFIIGLVIGISLALLAASWLDRGDS